MFGYLFVYFVCFFSVRVRFWVWFEGCRLSLYWLVSRILGCRVVVKEEGGVLVGKRGVGISARRVLRFCLGNRCWIE